MGNEQLLVALGIVLVSTITGGYLAGRIGAVAGFVVGLFLSGLLNAL